jgi:hypothetical protein
LIIYLGRCGFNWVAEDFAVSSSPPPCYQLLQADLNAEAIEYVWPSFLDHFVHNTLRWSCSVEVVSGSYLTFETSSNPEQVYGENMLLIIYLIPSHDTESQTGTCDMN